VVSQVLGVFLVLITLLTQHGELHSWRPTGSQNQAAAQDDKEGNKFARLWEDPLENWPTFQVAGVSPSPSPTSTPPPSPTSTQSPSRTATPSPSPTSTLSPSRTATPSPSPTSIPAERLGQTQGNPAPLPPPTPTAQPSSTPTPTAQQRATPKPTSQQGATITQKYTFLCNI